MQYHMRRSTLSDSFHEQIAGLIAGEGIVGRPQPMAKIISAAALQCVQAFLGNTRKSSSAK